MIRGIFATLSVLIVVLALTLVVSAQQPSLPPTIALETDVQYGTGGDVPLKMDIARPKTGDGPFPVVVFIHGGGWQAGNKESFRGAILGYASAGYVAVSVQYRLAPAHKFPAQIEDVKCAVRFLRSKAKELKINPDRIGATGGSAGGHLALLLAASHGVKELEGRGGHADFSSAVQAVCSLVGPTDLRATFPAAVQGMLKNLTGSTPGENKAVYERSSPVFYLDKSDPPMMGIYGTKDELVPYEQAKLLQEASQKAGVPLSLITIENGGHGSGGKPEDWATAGVKMLEFFNKHLKGK